METKEQINMVTLVAELFIQTPEDTQKDFLMNLMSVRPLFKSFSNAMLTNSIFHESIESMEKGSSGLTPSQLKKRDF